MVRLFVWRSVALSVGNDRVFWKNRDAICSGEWAGPTELWIRRGPDPPHGRGILGIFVLTKKYCIFQCILTAGMHLTPVGKTLKLLAVSCMAVEQHAVHFCSSCGRREMVFSCRKIWICWQIKEWLSYSPFLWQPCKDVSPNQRMQHLSWCCNVTQ